MKNIGKIKKLSDNELVKKYKATLDYDSIGELYCRYTEFVFAVCMKYLKNEEKCKDAVMEIFEKLIKDLLKFEIDNFKPWLHTVAKNHCLLTIRSEGYKQRFEKKYKIEQENFVENTNEMYLVENNKQMSETKIIYEALNQLKKEQKKCIELFYLQEKCYNEVSEITGFSMKQVKSYIQNGKRNLKLYLSKINTGNFKVHIIMFLSVLFNL